ncbi:MAG TPA: hypothetical protein VHI10_12985 [Mycobacterium sp.]|nr:hypothetical protein [Mycobacterium sp.]
MRGREVVARWLQASPATRVGGPVAALLLGVSGLFGGLDPVPLADRVGEVKPGTEVTVPPFALTVKRAVAVDQVEGVATPPMTGNHLMMVLLDAENLSDESLGSYLLSPVSRERSFLNRNLVVLDDRLAPETPSVYDADSNVAVSLLSPGLTYRLAVVWEFSGPVPERLPLGLAKLTRRGVTISPDELAWQDPEEAATLTLPVEDRTGGPA